MPCPLTNFGQSSATFSPHSTTTSSRNPALGDVQRPSTCPLSPRLLSCLPFAFAVVLAAAERPLTHEGDVCRGREVPGLWGHSCENQGLLWEVVTMSKVVRCGQCCRSRCLPVALTVSSRAVHGAEAYVSVYGTRSSCAGSCRA